MQEDPEERSKFVDEVFHGKPDLEFRAEYYEPYSENLGSIVSKGKDISMLKSISEYHKEKIESFLENHCIEGGVFIPLVGKKRDVLLEINKKTGSVEGRIDVNPWGAKHPMKTANLNEKE